MKNNSAFQSHEMDVHSWKKEFLLVILLPASHMTSDPTGLYNLQEISGSE